jgi:hypothetical protein
MAAKQRGQGAQPVDSQPDESASIASTAAWAASARSLPITSQIAASLLRARS